MINADDELRFHLEEIEKDRSEIKYAVLKVLEPYNEGKGQLFVVVDYSAVNDMFNWLNFCYDNYNKTQYLYGVVVYVDKSWSCRTFLGDDECWVYFNTPTLEESICSVLRGVNLEGECND